MLNLLNTQTNGFADDFGNYSDIPFVEATKFRTTSDEWYSVKPTYHSE